VSCPDPEAALPLAAVGPQPRYLQFLAVDVEKDQPSRSGSPARTNGTTSGWIATTTPLPQGLLNLAPGEVWQGVFSFPGSSGPAGAAGSLRVRVRHAAGSFVATLPVVLP